MTSCRKKLVPGHAKDKNAMLPCGVPSSLSHRVFGPRTQTADELRRDSTSKGFSHAILCSKSG